jgi:hypothetical protein
MPAGDASLKTAQLIKMLVDSNHGIYRVLNAGVAAQGRAGRDAV